MGRAVGVQAVMAEQPGCKRRLHSTSHRHQRRQVGPLGAVEGLGLCHNQPTWALAPESTWCCLSLSLPHCVKQWNQYTQVRTADEASCYCGQTLGQYATWLFVPQLKP